ncbi:methyltransferase domain-containing protein [Paenibacillus sp. PvR098]|uniref:class I SAM-dependent methyltransferase n=1 Tax=unclassified Paenibacillus TaxID=185978 RepID=UPI001B56EB4E|nr:2-polyprenyl-3-methyl-5-hydroxy-6-metoxy-1,4-benzoquinol methylase [Paenibacillus sp. PvP091]MBP1170172.1 2-polyprenyl-3-methyl-5-hydroxy-6-metoxy-1,4-benzoquinol methylase [Paenibacillus sp. PvR098]MBP2441200.1 2-polyprenyl-3-methyl-5-hydroxy-6-metoxy-1,4-benzoquinol methylase [Paenibacillus sp. PvP052]
MKETSKEQQWDAEHYNEQMGYGSRLGKGFIGLLQSKAEERILDLGCGTGDLTYEISLSGAGVTGLDSSEDSGM